MLFHDLYHSLEKARWSMADDVPWDDFDASLLTEEQALTIKYNAITEWAAQPRSRAGVIGCVAGQQ